MPTVDSTGWTIDRDLEQRLAPGPVWCGAAGLPQPETRGRREVGLPRRVQGREQGRQHTHQRFSIERVEELARSALRDGVEGTERFADVDDLRHWQVLRSVARRTAVLQKIFIRGAEPHDVLAAIAAERERPRPLAMRDALERVDASLEQLREERRHRGILLTVATIHRHGYTVELLLSLVHYPAASAFTRSRVRAFFRRGVFGCMWP